MSRSPHPGPWILTILERHPRGAPIRTHDALPLRRHLSTSAWGRHGGLRHREHPGEARARDIGAVKDRRLAPRHAVTAAALRRWPRPLALRPPPSNRRERLREQADVPAIVGSPRSPAQPPTAPKAPPAAGDPHVRPRHDEDRAMRSGRISTPASFSFVKSPEFGARAPGTGTRPRGAVSRTRALLAVRIESARRRLPKAGRARRRGGTDGVRPFSCGQAAARTENPTGRTDEKAAAAPNKNQEGRRRVIHSRV